MIIASSLVVLAYLVGSISTAIIACKVMGLPDPRSLGSKNPGATNVLRYGGKQAAIITLLGDILKGFIPILIASTLSSDPIVLALVAFSAFLGHLYPIYFRFQGGKGVATAFGVLLGISWPVALLVLLTWIAMTVVFKISSLSALCAAFITPLTMWLIEPEFAYRLLSFGLAILLIWRHRSNIQLLLQGTEEKIKDNKS